MGVRSIDLSEKLRWKERRRRVSLVGILNFHHNLIAVPIITLRTNQHGMSSATECFSQFFQPSSIYLVFRGANEGREENEEVVGGLIDLCALSGFIIFSTHIGLLIY